jgi:ABC-type transport system involved in multi-copper enzyme maturation permease subunit
MGATTAVMPASAADQGSGSAAAHAREVARSEWCKFRSVRSTWWALAAVVIFNVLTAALLAVFLPRALPAHERATIDSVRVSLGGLHLSQVAVGLLGVLVITGEYSSGMIRASLAAVPQRRLLLAAKTAVFAAAAMVTGIAACLAAYLIFQAFLPAGDAMRTSLTDPGVARAVVGAGLYLAVLGLLGLGLGAVIRSAAGGVAALLGLLFVPSILITLLPASWQNTVGRYLPMNAGEVIYTVHHQAHTLAPWAGLGVFCGYAAAALLAGFIMISRRDA